MHSLLAKLFLSRQQMVLHTYTKRCTSNNISSRNERGCHQGPRLPRATEARPSAPPDPAQCPKRHACHAKRRWMSPSAMPATQNEGGCRQVPRLPRKMVRRPGRPKRAQARHQSRWMSPSSTLATQNEGGCHQVPGLPRKRKLDVAKCHASHEVGVWKMVWDKDGV